MEAQISPVLAVVQVSAMFPPGMSHTVLLEMHEDGTVTWKEFPNRG
jgi:hypothetical protein